MKKHTNLWNEVYVGKEPKTDYFTITVLAATVATCFIIFVVTSLLAA